ncbi:MAG: redox-sensing transcriptional repressor Rex [Spirochaetae bacterium HGW-Spirochaetae-3]|jgi:redox-sensing transcriptional repressor|nr:MAG: redox-sensing transcriptional repressor Rex [Spirochaetae bacterium HGW-Spirochaetae-3]
MIEPIRISLPTLKRLPLYRRILEEKAAAGETWISSDSLARRLGQCAVQVRKDLAQAGIVGKAKYGFPVGDSISAIDAALGADESRDIFVIGAGPMAEAVLADEGLAAHGFKAVAVFEPDPSLVGTSIGVAGLRALPMSKLPDLARRMGVRVAVLTVGSPWAQVVADGLAGSGIIAVLDLSPVHPEFPNGVRSARADFGAAIATLSAGLA